MLPIIWLPTARDDLAHIVRYIAEDNLRAARRLERAIEDSVIPASQFPYMYHESERVPGCREIVVRPGYIVLYRVTTAVIEVIAVFHGRRQFPTT